MKAADSLVGIFGVFWSEWPIALSYMPYMYVLMGLTFVAINPHAFTAGSEECVSTFSQEMRA